MLRYRTIKKMCSYAHSITLNNLVYESDDNDRDIYYYVQSHRILNRTYMCNCGYTNESNTHG